ncbi:MAG: hypothetical protein ACR2O4_07775 [Hyphomicrobiaceae bacterium]
MSNVHAKSPGKSRRSAVAQRAALIAAMRHVAPVDIDNSEEQFADYNDDELWDLADETEDDDLYRAVESEIMRREMSRRENFKWKRKRFGGPVRTTIYVLLIAFLIIGPILAMWFFG